ncbi:MAG: sulfatase [Actinomycetota bacterium]
MRARPWCGLVAVLVLATAPSLGMPRSVITIDRVPPTTSVLLIVTDDQRWDTLWAMPRVQRLLVERGLRFDEAFVSNPLCCPSRATILTGDLSHTTGVYRVTPPYGGFVSFHDADTLATRLHGAGYATGLFGKYLDAYQGAAVRGYVPPGWDRWVAMVHSQYEGYKLTVDGEVTSAAPGDYAPDVLGDEAEAFIRGTAGPLFVMYAPPTPHAPATPRAADAGAFADLEPARPPSYDRPIDGAPQHMRDLPPVDDATVQDLRRDQYASLLAVDRQVASLVRALRDTGRLRDTLIVFTSDNGLQWGEHGWTKKEVPYEESIRVPLVMRLDREGTAGASTPAMVLNTDLAPTIVDAAGVDAAASDGQSLMPLLRDPSGPGRAAIVLEHMRGTNPVPTYCGVRTTEAKFVRYATGEEELFDLRADPFELRNIATTSPERDRMASMLDAMCRPRPPGWFDGRGGPAAAAIVALALGLAVASRRRYSVGLAGPSR